MSKLNKLEYNVIVSFRNSQKQEEENERLRDLGLPIDDTPQRPERMVKYSFCPEDIVEYRQTFITFRDQEMDGVVCMFTNQYVHETPILLVHYDQFEKDLEKYYEQYDKKEFEAEQE